MAFNTAERLNNSLRSLFNVDDEIFTSLISDVNGAVPSVVSKPSDIDIGVVASMIEYLFLLTDNLSKQIYVNSADHEFLKFTLEEFFDSVQISGESDADWLARSISTLFQPKVSNAAIIYAMIPFSPGGMPSISSGAEDSMFADCSFCEMYVLKWSSWGGSPFLIYPSFSNEFNDTLFSLIVTLFNAETSKLTFIADILTKMKAAGIFLTIEIKYI